MKLYEVISGNAFTTERGIYRQGDYVERKHILIGDDRFRRLPEPPELKTLESLVAGCDWLRDRWRDETIPALEFGYGIVSDWQIDGFEFAGCPKAEYLRWYLDSLVTAAVDLGMADPPETGRLNERQRTVALNRVREWAESRPPKKETQPFKKRTRPAKGETSGETKVLAAIKALLNVPEHGRDTPPKGKKIAKTAKVSGMTVSRFMEDHFGGQSNFEGAWRRDEVRTKLAFLEYAPERHNTYREESGEDFDE